MPSKASPETQLRTIKAELRRTLSERNKAVQDAHHLRAAIKCLERDVEEWKARCDRLIEAIGRTNGSGGNDG